MKDLIIIGAGPAGLSAGIYGKRAGLDVLVIDESPIGGGQVVTTYEVDNYPGLPGISGMELGEKMKAHAEATGVEFDCTTVLGVNATRNNTYDVVTDDKKIETKALIIATGAMHNHLGVEGEEELAGMGVSYCATCDGAFFRGRVTAVVGGGDVALEDALFLARSCSKVYLIHRRDEFRGAKILVDAVLGTDNIEVIYDNVLEKISGEDMVENIELKNVKTGEGKKLDVSGVFIAVGTHPVTEVFDGLVEMDEKGHIIAGEEGITSAPGVFVAGDARTKKLRQIITAAADGANAVTSVCDYLNQRQ